MLAQFNEWHVTSCFFGCLTDVFVTNTDTIVNDLNYAILDGFHFINRNFLLREDTAARQVFMLTTGLVKDNPEYILYDFSLAVGDSMYVFNPFGPLPDSAGYFVVDSIVPRIQIDGDSRRHFYLTSSNPSLSSVTNAEWIEGIGSLGLVTTPGTSGNINGSGALSCFFNDLTLKYSNLDSITGCIQVNTNLKVESEKHQSFVQLFPNPAKSHVVIKTEGELIKNVKIYDLFGREVISKSEANPQNSVNISLNNLMAGCYFVKIRTTNGQFYQKKLWIE